MKILILAIVLLNSTYIMSNNKETATLGAGCFWCVEAIFDQVKGVESAESGYSGGHIVNPTYKEVCAGNTGHAEVVQVVFDPEVISYAKILEIFFKTHDPTTLNRQGNDVGTQYRSAIFYHSEEQKQIAQEIKTNLGSAEIWKNDIVTEIVPFENYYPAENYHQEYYQANKEQPYCNFVITPKFEKFKKVFGDYMK
ncbi:MAG: peptide-methionine (S)-S-oxide reductase MsrA [Bacteroidales bacterium]|nr:peptide-methionine (S)-S-oxide reductase MsrA [Bacteroidales bacterium]